MAVVGAVEEWLSADLPRRIRTWRCEMNVHTTSSRSTVNRVKANLQHGQDEVKLDKRGEGERLLKVR